VAEGECDLAVAFDVQVPRNVRKIATVSLPLGVLRSPRAALHQEGTELFDLSGETCDPVGNSLMLGFRRRRFHALAD